jgi:hypothetical protein
MLTHIVSFKYRADVPDAVRDDHRRRLAGLLVTFNDRAGLEAYAVHPQHVPVAQFGASLCDQIVAVDFE